MYTLVGRVALAKEGEQRERGHTDVVLRLARTIAHAVADLAAFSLKAVAVPGAVRRLVILEPLKRVLERLVERLATARRLQVAATATTTVLATGATADTHDVVLVVAVKRRVGVVVRVTDHRLERLIDVLFVVVGNLDVADDRLLDGLDLFLDLFDLFFFRLLDDLFGRGFNRGLQGRGLLLFVGAVHEGRKNEQRENVRRSGNRQPRSAPHPIVKDVVERGFLFPGLGKGHLNADVRVVLLAHARSGARNGGVRREFKSINAPENGGFKVYRGKIGLLPTASQRRAPKSGLAPRRLGLATDPGRLDFKTRGSAHKAVAP